MFFELLISLLTFTHCGYAVRLRKRVIAVVLVCRLSCVVSITPVVIIVIFVGQYLGKCCTEDDKVNKIHDLYS